MAPQTQTKTRIAYLDVLRIAATLAVVVIHVCANRWLALTPADPGWHALNVYDGLLRWALPVFLMISGALLLEQEASIGRLHRRYLLRAVCAFVFWSVVYFAVAAANAGKITLHDLPQLVQGHYHMWYLLMIGGMYLIVPFLKKITEDPRLTRYFLLLSLLFAVVIPQTTVLLRIFAEPVGATLRNTVGNIHFGFTTGYVGVFVLGWVLSRHDLSKTAKRWLYAGALLSAVLTVVLTVCICNYTGTTEAPFFEYLTVNVLTQSAAVFVWAKDHIRLSEKAARAVSRLSRYSLGVYLSHPLIIEQLRLAGVDSDFVPAWIGVPLLTAAVTAAAFAISWLLKKIPVIGDYAA